MEFVLLRTLGQVSALSPAAETLIQQVVASPDATHRPEYFLPRVHSRAEPRVVACYQSGSLVGILYTYELLVLGLPTGFAFGGDQMGRGLLVCAVDQEREILAACCNFLLENGIHALRLAWTPRGPAPLTAIPLVLTKTSAHIKTVADPRQEGDWLPLAPEYRRFLAKLGPHTRRNLRYYRRKAEAAGLAYTGILDASKIPAALHSLNRLADYPIKQERRDRDNRYMTAFGTPVVAGLRAADGEFVSLVTGFTVGTHLHILTQLNGEAAALRKLSLSLVLRGYLIEDFIQRGFTAVHFFEGSSPMLGRFCEPVLLQHISIDNRSSWASPVKQALVFAGTTLRLSGKRVPHRLQWAAGSFWA